MGFDLQLKLTKSARRGDHKFDTEGEKTAEGEKSHENGCTKGDPETGIRMNRSFGTHIMGDPAKPSSNPDNKLAATWIAPQLMPEDRNVKFKAAESPNGNPDHKTRGPNAPPVGSHGKPLVRLGPYVLNSNTAASAPPGKCKGPCLTSLKTVAEFLCFPSYVQAQIDAFMERLNRWSKNADNLAESFCSHMKLGSSMSETVWGKLSLGAKIVAEGGVENLFKLSFSVGPNEKLLKTSACYLSTTTGPVVGLLFISTEKLAFCSDRPLCFTCPEGGVAWSYYRVLIPLGRVSSVNAFENVKKPAEKYIQILTVDNHEFWFMGFVNYHKAFKYLQEAVRSR